MASPGMVILGMIIKAFICEKSRTVILGKEKKSVS